MMMEGDRHLHIAIDEDKYIRLHCQQYKTHIFDKIVINLKVRFTEFSDLLFKNTYFLPWIIRGTFM